MAGRGTGRDRRQRTTNGAAAVAGLKRDDVAAMLRRMAPADRRQLFSAAGLRLDPARIGERGPELLCSRLGRLPPRAAHEIALLIAARVLPTLIDAVDGFDLETPDSDQGPEADDEDDGEGSADLIEAIAEVLPMLVQQWSPGVVRVALGCVRDAAGFDRSTYAALLARVDGSDGAELADIPALLDGTSEAEGETPSETPPDLAEGERPAPAPTPPPPERTDPGSIAARTVEGSAGGPLCLLVLEAVHEEAARPGRPTPAGLTAGAVEQLVALAPTETAPWVVHGVAESLGVVAPPVALALTESLSDHRLAGTVAGHASLGDLPVVGQVVATSPDGARRLAGGPAGRAIAAPMIRSVVDDDPGLAASLLTQIAAACDGWVELIEAVQSAAGRLLGRADAVAAESLLRAADDALSSWAGESGLELGSADQFHRGAAAIAVGRAQCRRARRDFTGALRLLERVGPDLLPPAGRSVMLAERALCGARLASLAALDPPGGAPDRARLGDRLGRVRSELAESVALDPTNLTALVLGGVLAACIGDDEKVVHDLAPACARLDELGSAPRLAAALRLELAVAELRLLEPGTDEAGYAAVTAVLDGDHEVEPTLLVSAAEALDAHGSPRAAEIATAAARLAPRHQPALELLAKLARRGDPAAVEAAHELAAGERSAAERFELLRAALDGAGRAGDAGRAEDVVAQLDDVLARACSASLDDAWAGVLATDENLRELLDPALADSIRVTVLRRIGRLDEAVALARALFHRAAAGSLPGHDPLELVNLLEELGCDPDELEPLRRRVTPPERAEAPPERCTPRLVLFVGGDESQARHDAAVEKTLAARYGEAIRVEWFHTGWGSGWAADADRVEARYEGADAVVIMTLMRTMLGRRLRRTAGEAGVPWVACTGQGRASIERSIERAAELAAAGAARTDSGAAVVRS